MGGKCTLVEKLERLEEVAPVSVLRLDEQGEKDLRENEAVCDYVAGVGAEPFDGICDELEAERAPAPRKREDWAARRRGELAHLFVGRDSSVATRLQSNA